MKTILFIAVCSTTITTASFASEASMICHSSPLKLVNSLFFDDKVFRRKQGVWVDFCNEQNQTLEIEDGSAICITRKPMFVADKITDIAKTYEKLCLKRSGSLKSHHTSYIESPENIQDICSKGEENFFKLFHETYINVVKSQTNYWISKTIYDFELAKYHNVDVGALFPLEKNQIAVHPESYNHRAHFLDVSGKPWIKMRDRLHGPNHIEGGKCERL
jgi:hypothetical protein